MDKSDVDKGKQSDMSDGVVKQHNKNIAKTSLIKTPAKFYSNCA